MRDPRSTVFFWMALALLPLDVNALSGREIMERYDALPKGDSVHQENALVILRGSHKEIKEFHTRTRRESKAMRSRISFTSPTHIEYLVWDEPGLDTRQWMKMSSGRVRKIAVSDNGNSWMNSDFYNEDISDFDIDDYTYELIGEEEIGGEACFVVKAVTNKMKNIVYDSVVIYLAEKDFFVRKIDFIENGKHTKTAVFDNIELIDNILTPRKTTMELQNGESKSIIYVKTVDYKATIPDIDLTREAF